MTFLRHTADTTVEKCDQNVRIKLMVKEFDASSPVETQYKKICQFTVN